MNEFLNTLLGSDTLSDALLHADRAWWYVAGVSAAVGIPILLLSIIIYMGKPEQRHVRGFWRNTMEPSLLIALPIAAGMAYLSSGVLVPYTQNAVQEQVAVNLQETYYLGSARVVDVHVDDGLTATIEIYPDTEYSEQYTMVYDPAEEIMVPEDDSVADAFPRQDATSSPSA